jgi:hypothetical protein
VAEIEISGEALDAADKALSGTGLNLQDVERALEAAAPLIVADELERLVRKLHDEDPLPVRASRTALDVIVAMSERAAELRGGA